MASYPEIMAEDQRLAAGAQGCDPVGSDEGIGDRSPPVRARQDERRMQVRAYNLWASLLGSREFPRIEDLTQAGMPDFAGNAVLLDFSDGPENPAVTMLGHRLAEECGATGTIDRLSDLPSATLLSRITDRYGEILISQAPIGFDAEFVNQRGKTLLCRGLLLPFSGDGNGIAHIMGVINWKELADPGLIRAIENSGLDPLPDSPPQGEWADGPALAQLFDPDSAPFAEFDLGSCPSAEWTPADWLASARELAQAAVVFQDRSRAALYAAISRAWDFALAAEAEARIVAPSGSAVRAGGSLMPLVQQVFGADRGRTRLTQYATALAFARREGVGTGGMAELLAETPGGLKGLISQECKLRRAEAEEHHANLASSSAGRNKAGSSHT